MRTTITSRQNDLLAYLKAEIERHGIAPTIGEMQAALDLASKSGVVRLLKGLEERGHIRRLSRRARAIEIIALPQGPTQGAAVLRALRLAGVTLKAKNLTESDLEHIIGNAIR